MEEKASCDKSRVPRHPGGGQYSTIVTMTELPLQGWGSPRLVPLRQVTLYLVPHAPPLSQIASLAAAIITPSSLYPLQAEVASPKEEINRNVALPSSAKAASGKGRKTKAMARKEKWGCVAMAIRSLLQSSPAVRNKVSTRNRLQSFNPQQQLECILYRWVQSLIVTYYLIVNNLTV
ncbi:unnamed protein product [Ilex paraguariensis]|uniref:Uncharacterized protein n=1 Tax=Ilex paraguariensis TaxID=185542 RepID=A0ABC8TZ53_9AQUA